MNKTLPKTVIEELEECLEKSPDYGHTLKEQLPDGRLLAFCGYVGTKYVHGPIPRCPKCISSQYEEKGFASL